MHTVRATTDFWRLYEFKVHNRCPSVYSLDIHLEDQQDIYFEDDTVIRNILKGEPKRTHIVSFFEYNEQNFGVKKELTYIEFVERLAYQPDKKVWYVRKNQNPEITQQHIGRLPMLNPDGGEVFYLRVILSHIQCKGGNLLLG